MGGTRRYDQRERHDEKTRRCTQPDQKTASKYHCRELLYLSSIPGFWEESKVPTKAVVYDIVRAPAERDAELRGIPFCLPLNVRSNFEVSKFTDSSKIHGGSGVFQAPDSDGAFMVPAVYFRELRFDHEHRYVFQLVNFTFFG